MVSRSCKVPRQYVMQLEVTSVCVLVGQTAEMLEQLPQHARATTQVRAIPLGPITLHLSKAAQPADPLRSCATAKAALLDPAARSPP